MTISINGAKPASKPKPKQTAEEKAKQPANKAKQTTTK